MAQFSIYTLILFNIFFVTKLRSEKTSFGKVTLPLGKVLVLETAKDAWQKALQEYREKQESDFEQFMKHQSEGFDDFKADQLKGFEEFKSGHFTRTKIDTEADSQSDWVQWNR
jgi:hypothetical protein